MSGALDEGVVDINDRFYWRFIQVAKKKSKIWKASGSQTIEEYKIPAILFYTVGCRKDGSILSLLVWLWIW